MVLFLSNEDVETLLSWSEVVRVCESVLLERVQGSAFFAPRERFVMPTGTAFLLLPGGATALNIMGARTYATPPGPTRVAAQHALEANSLVFVFDMRTAELLAVAAGEWINSLRTAGLGAVGTKYLASKTSSRVGVLGSGQLA